MSGLRKSAPFYAAAIACFVAVALALPALAVWLGLPIEGDAVDYRVPLVRWMVAHHAIPNWPWTFVDDYPLLGDIAMAVFYAISPNLMRLLPIFGYVTCAWFAGKIFARLAGETDHLERRTAFLTAVAWAFGLRPLNLQANILLVDTLASGLTLGALAFLLSRRPLASGLFAALALSTRYTTWANVAVIGLLWLWRAARDRKFRPAITFFAVAALGALPWMIRNWVVNHNPFFPLANGLFNGHSIDAFDQWGRGKRLLDLALLPYDVLYTNTFVRGFFDYTIGKFFYAQLLVLAGCALLRPRAIASAARELLRNPGFVPAAIFALGNTLTWFYSSPQLRFLVPALVIVNLFMLFLLWRALPRLGLAALTILCVLSVWSVEKDSILIALGKRESPFAEGVAKARDCFARAGVTDASLVGHFSRDGVLGFFGHPFVYGGTHSYLVKDRPAPVPDFVYDPQNNAQPGAGFEAWPRAAPCLWKNVSAFRPG